MKSHYVISIEHDMRLCEQTFVGGGGGGGNGRHDGGGFCGCCDGGPGGGYKGRVFIFFSLPSRVSVELSRM